MPDYTLFAERRPVPAKHGEGESIIIQLSPEAVVDRATNAHASEDLFEYCRIVWRRKASFLANVVVCAVVAAGLTWMQPAQYRASSSLEFQGLNQRFLNIGDVDPIARDAGVSYDGEIETQLELLRSKALIGRVVSRLKLDERFGDPAPPRWWSLPSLSPKNVDSRQDRAIEAAAANLKASGVRGTRIIRVAFDSTDPKLAADFLNALVEEFINHQTEIRAASSERTGQWLAKQLNDLKLRLQKSEDDLRTYARDSGLLVTSDQENVAEQKLKPLQDELSRAQSERMARQARYEVVNLSGPGSLPGLLDDPILREYQSKLTGLRQKLAELRFLLTPSHYKVEQVQAQVVELESALVKEETNTRGRIANEYRSAQVREQLLTAEFERQLAFISRQDDKAVRYSMLKREVSSNQQLYGAMLQKMKEVNLTSALPTSNILIVDSAEIPRQPHRPNLLLNTGLGLLAGVFFGAILVFTVERTDGTVRRPGDLFRCTRVRELGVIPSKKPAKRIPFGRKATLGLLAGSQWQEQQDDPPIELATYGGGTSLLGEAFRATAISLLFSSDDTCHSRVIVVTSPGQGDGKTTVISNVGIALALLGRRVLLIDANVRRPQLHRIFGSPNVSGLVDFLEGASQPDCALKELAHKSGIPGLCLLTSGGHSAAAPLVPRFNRAPDLLQACRREFDTVLIDTPPVLDRVDARVLGHLADAVVLVCRAGTTHRGEVAAAAGRLAADGTPVLGTVLNACDLKTTNYRLRN